jgi:hypothetical protein
VVAESVNACIFVGTTLGANSAAGILKVGIVGGAAGVAIDGATGAVPPANALQIATLAASANPANATAGRQTPIMSDLAGRIVMTPVNARGLVKGQATSISAIGATTIVTAGAAGVFNDICLLVITTAGLAAQTTAATAWTANQSAATACHYLVNFAQRLG